MVDWDAFVKELRSRQQKLREELRPYEDGTMRVWRGPRGATPTDITDERISTIKGEIASLQRTIDQVIAEQGLGEG
jgi:predicted transcriptional regulator